MPQARDEMTKREREESSEDESNKRSREEEETESEEEEKSSKDDLYFDFRTTSFYKKLGLPRLCTQYQVTDL